MEINNTIHATDRTAETNVFEGDPDLFEKRVYRSLPLMGLFIFLIVFFALVYAAMFSTAAIGGPEDRSAAAFVSVAFVLGILSLIVLLAQEWRKPKKGTANWDPPRLTLHVDRFDYEDESDVKSPVRTVRYAEIRKIKVRSAPSNTIRWSSVKIYRRRGSVDLRDFGEVNILALTLGRKARVITVIEPDLPIAPFLDHLHHWKYGTAYPEYRLRTAREYASDFAIFMSLQLAVLISVFVCLTLGSKEDISYPAFLIAVLLSISDICVLLTYSPQAYVFVALTLGLSFRSIRFWFLIYFCSITAIAAGALIYLTFGYPPGIKFLALLAFFSVPLWGPIVFLLLFDPNYYKERVFDFRKSAGAPGSADSGEPADCRT